MNYKIALMPGDGIGPEVIEQAKKILEVVQENTRATFEFEELSIGADSIERFSTPLTDEAIKVCLNSDAILFGAIGDPKYDNSPDLEQRPEQGLLKLRKELELFANVRPVSAYGPLLHHSPLKEQNIEGVDIVIYRELTSGIYFGEKSEGNEEAFDTCSYTKDEIDRILKLAFEAASSRSKRLTLIDKANVMATSRLWRKRAQIMSTDYPTVQLDTMFVDNVAMQMVINPKQFDVIVTSNMFGDIISDEASVIGGSIGLLPSSSIGNHTALFEPIHGSYPQAKGLNTANPIGTILSVAMMFDHFEEFEIAKIIRSSVEQSFQEGVVTVDLDADNNFTTNEVGAYIAIDVAKRLSESYVRDGRLLTDYAT